METTYDVGWAPAAGLKRYDAHHLAVGCLMSNSSGTSRNRWIAAGVSLAVLAVFAVWMLWPPGAKKSGTAEVLAERQARRKAKLKMKMIPPGDAVLPTPEYLPLEEDPTIPVVTKTCKWIVTDERRNVPQWVMLDNLRDRGQLFVEDDIRCLTAAGVTPAILDFAERYQDQNKIQGKVGRPPGQ